MGYLDEPYRVVGRLEEVRAVLEEAAQRARANANRRMILVNQIRLAEVKRYSGDLAEAEMLLRRALQHTQDPDLADYRDFALQHLAKCCLDLEKVDEAVTLFEKALFLRQRKGEERLIAWTELGLAHARSQARLQVEDGDR